MTYSIPHGVYLKLEKIPGIYIERSGTSGRDLFHFKLGIQEYCLVDNGYNNISKTFWRFFNSFSDSFNFGSDYLPIKVTITDRTYTFINSKEKSYSFIPEGGKIFLEVLEAYYGEGLPNIIIEDKRKDYFQKLVEHKQKIIDEKKCEIEQIQKEIEKIDLECSKIYDDIYYITKWGFPPR